MAMELVDIGVNLTNKAFAADLDDVIKSAEDAGVKRMIVTGTSLRASQQAAALAVRYSGKLFSTAGIHPHDAKSFNDSSLKSLKSLLSLSYVLAVGECGLDYNRDFSPRDVQRQVFEKQVDLAISLKMPLFTHERDAHDDFLAILNSACSQIPVVVHCFTGTADELSNYLEAGCYIGLTGWICDERRGEHLKSIVRSIPLDRLMLETDAPYIAPRDIRPRINRNEPKYVAHICAAIARHVGVSAEQLAALTTANAYRFFNISK